MGRKEADLGESNKEKITIVNSVQLHIRIVLEKEDKEDDEDYMRNGRNSLRRQIVNRTLMSQDGDLD